MCAQAFKAPIIDVINSVPWDQRAIIRVCYSAHSEHFLKDEYEVILYIPELCYYGITFLLSFSKGHVVCPPKSSTLIKKLNRKKQMYQY